jgi:anti-sigma regulatory factor (Ser/Thr protein kinase)
MSLVGGHTLTQMYPAVPDSVPLARRELVRFAAAAGTAGDQLESVRLSVSEALTNVVMHAYRDGVGQIHVTADLAGGELWVLIADDGHGLRPHNDSPGLGVGLALIAKSSDGLTIMNRSGGGTEVRMCFSLDGDDRGELAQSREPDLSELTQDRESSRSASMPATPRF